MSHKQCKRRWIKKKKKKKRKRRKIIPMYTFIVATDYNWKIIFLLHSLSSSLKYSLFSLLSLLFVSHLSILYLTSLFHCDPTLQWWSSIFTVVIVFQSLRQWFSLSWSTLRGNAFDLVSVWWPDLGLGVGSVLSVGCGGCW